MNTKLRYLLHGSEVRSKDGDVHWISAQRLAKLYGLKPYEYKIYNYNSYEDYSKLNLIDLYSCDDGNYAEVLGYYTRRENAVLRS